MSQKFDEKPKGRINLIMRPMLERKLRETAIAEETTMTQIIERALRRYFSRK